MSGHDDRVVQKGLELQRLLFADGYPFDGAYPAVPGSVPDVSGASEDAAESMVPHAGRLQLRVIAALAGASRLGLTDDKLEEILCLSHQSVSARRRECVLNGWVEPQVLDSGKIERRLTRSGRTATVWVLTPAGREVWALR